jgi:uncharacterized protein YeaO (DUF488 family)
MDAWLKELAPSTELRRWFGHRPDRWDEFRKRYQGELGAKSAALEPLLDAARRGPVTLLYSAHDTEHNGALVLRDHVAARIRRGQRGSAKRAPARSRG